MGLFDSAKQAAEKAQEYAAEHGDQVKDGIGKAAAAADKATGGAHADNIAKVERLADEQVDKLQNRS